ncbi:MAG TPA: hypothetical protein VKZ79_02690 [Alphaproteobacteria bacterium]|nr:hypothetical protein [Alphaproteobacteria bacterium]
MKPVIPILAAAWLMTAGCAVKTAGPVEFTCKAQSAWQNTGVLVHAGDRLVVEYETGEWTADIRNGLAPPAGNPLTPAKASDILPGVNRSALIGRVDDQVFLIGNAFDGVVPKDGRLYCAINTTITKSDQMPLLAADGWVTMRAWVNRAHPVCSDTVWGVCSTDLERLTNF